MHPDVEQPAPGGWQSAPVVADAPQVPAKGMNVQGPDGAVVSFPDGTDPATVDQVMRQNFSGGQKPPSSSGWGGDPGPKQGNASQWGPLQEGVNSFMFGAGPAVNEWLGKNAPTWMLATLATGAYYLRE